MRPSLCRAICRVAAHVVAPRLGGRSGRRPRYQKGHPLGCLVRWHWTGLLRESPAACCGGRLCRPPGLRRRTRHAPCGWQAQSPGPRQQTAALMAPPGQARQSHRVARAGRRVYCGLGPGGCQSPSHGKRPQALALGEEAHARGPPPAPDLRLALEPHPMLPGLRDTSPACHGRG